jgi:hypothetical protein
VNGDHIAALVQNLERKVFKKFDLIDERLKGFQDESYKKKNEFSNLVAMIDSANKSGNSNKETILKEFSEKVVILTDLINSKENQLKTKFDEQINNFSDSINSKLKDLSSNLNTQGNEKKEEDFEKELEKQKQAISETDMKLLKDLTKKVNDLDRAFRIFNKYSYNNKVQSTLITSSKR